MKELKATRVPPGDRWIIIDDDKEPIKKYSFIHH